jgi:hypothetical protein
MTRYEFGAPFMHSNNFTTCQPNVILLSCYKTRQLYEEPSEITLDVKFGRMNMQIMESLDRIGLMSTGIYCFKSMI